MHVGESRGYSTECIMHVGESHGYSQVTIVDWMVGHYEHPNINFAT